MLIGESYIGEGAEAAHVNTVLGERAGPVGVAWATALATPSAGHTPFVAVVIPVGSVASGVSTWPPGHPSPRRTWRRCVTSGPKPSASWAIATAYRGATQGSQTCWRTRVWGLPPTAKRPGKATAQSSSASPCISPAGRAGRAARFPFTT